MSIFLQLHRYCSCCYLLILVIHFRLQLVSFIYSEDEVFDFLIALSALPCVVVVNIIHIHAWRLYATGVKVIRIH